MGILARHEPENIVHLRENREVFTIFQEARWKWCFQILNEFHVDTALLFSLKLIDTHSIVRGLQINVTKAIVVEVTRLPQISEGDQFDRSTRIYCSMRNCLAKRKGKSTRLLPRPWDQVVIFLKKYITCEGRYQIIQISYFILLSHLCHGRLLNIPLYLLRALQSMDQCVKESRHPVASLTNHGLIKLLVLRALAHHNLTQE